MNAHNAGNAQECFHDLRVIQVLWGCFHYDLCRNDKKRKKESGKVRKETIYVWLSRNSKWVREAKGSETAKMLYQIDWKIIERNNASAHRAAKRLCFGGGTKFNFQVHTRRHRHPVSLHTVLPLIAFLVSTEASFFVVSHLWIRGGRRKWRGNWSGKIFFAISPLKALNLIFHVYRVSKLPFHYV